MIYFAQRLAGKKLIKIGATGNVLRRIDQLEKEFGCRFNLLHLLAGFEDIEKIVHARFDHLRYGRNTRRKGFRRIEYFAAAPDLMEFIGHPKLTSRDREVRKDIKAMSERIVLVGAGLERSVFLKARCITRDRNINLKDYLARRSIAQIKYDFDRLFRRVLRMEDDPSGYRSIYKTANREKIIKFINRRPVKCSH